jgi:hypothetical protein
MILAEPCRAAIPSKNHTKLGIKKDLEEGQRSTSSGGIVVAALMFIILLGMHREVAARACL